MATDLRTITSSVRMRWNEPYVSEGLNRKTLPFPFGIFRGFKVIPSATNFNVTIQADTTKGDHLAVFETSGGTRYSLTIAIAADLADISLSAFAGTTIYLAIDATYSTGVATEAKIKAYTTAEWAGLPVNSVITLAQVTVPLDVSTDVGAGAGKVMVSYAGRSSAWANQSNELMPWQPLVRNGGFEASQLTGAYATAGMNVQFWRLDNTNLFVTDGTSGQQHGGARHCLVKTTGGGTYSGNLYQTINAPVRAGSHVRIKAWKKVLRVPAGGTVQLFVEFGDASGAVASTATYTILSASSSIDGSYQAAETTFTAPSPGSGGVYIRRAGLKVTNLDCGGAYNALRVDDFQVWAEVTDVLDPLAYNERRGDVVSSGVLLEDAASTNFDDAAAMISFDKTANALTLGNRSGAESPGLKAKGLVLGGQIGAGSPTYKRLEFPYNVSDVFTLLYAATGTSSKLHHVYADANGGLVIAVNATWNGTGWAYSDATVAATKYVFGTAGLSMYRYASGQTTPWVDGSWVADNLVLGTNVLDFLQQSSTPSTPASGTARFFFRSNGLPSPDTRMQMCVMWPTTGDVTVIAEGPAS